MLWNAFWTVPQAMMTRQLSAAAAGGTWRAQGMATLRCRAGPAHGSPACSISSQQSLVSAGCGDLKAEGMGGAPLVGRAGRGAAGGWRRRRCGLGKARGGQCTSRPPVPAPLPLHPCHCTPATAPDWSRSWRAHASWLRGVAWLGGRRRHDSPVCRHHPLYKPAAGGLLLRSWET